MQADLRVHLDAFQGPLDLLLYLIRRRELDIHDIPIARIAQDFNDVLDHAMARNPASLDIDQAGEFLVMAASLMEIKARVIAAENGHADPSQPDPNQPDPNQPDPNEPGTHHPRAARDADPRLELVQQLLEYKRYREAADALESRREAWSRRQPVRPAAVHAEELRAALEAAGADLELEDLSLGDIVAAFERIAASVNLDRLGEHQVLSDDTPIELHAADLMQRLREQTDSGGQLTLFGVLQGRTRAEMVGLLLAMLDLVRQGRLTFRQDQDEAGAREAGMSILLIPVEPQQPPEQQAPEQQAPEQQAPEQQAQARSERSEGDRA